jgi:hypothetical protein
MDPRIPKQTPNTEKKPQAQKTHKRHQMRQTTQGSSTSSEISLDGLDLRINRIDLLTGAGRYSQSAANS